MGIAGYVLTTLTQFLPKRSQYVVVNGCQSNLVNVASGVPREGVLALLCTSELFSILENKLYGYAYNYTLVAAVPSYFQSNSCRLSELWSQQS